MMPMFAFPFCLRILNYVFKGANDDYLLLVMLANIQGGAEVS